MLRGKHGARLEFLRKRSLPNLPEDKPGVREDVVKDWNHIHETVRIVSKTLHHAIFYRWEILGCLKSLMWSEARFLQVQMAGIWGSQRHICSNISFFHFELTGKFKDRAPAPFAQQAWPTSWRTIWRCSQNLRSATLSRLSKASSSASSF